jgi:hypothetical protein
MLKSLRFQHILTDDVPSKCTGHKNYHIFKGSTLRSRNCTDAKTPHYMHSVSENNHTRINGCIQVEFFWIVTPCSVMVGYQRFRAPCCLHVQGEVTKSALEPRTRIFTAVKTSNLTNCYMFAVDIVFVPTLKFLNGSFVLESSDNDRCTGNEIIH